ncbi:MAG: integrase [Solirubrobacterales bacterium]|nr:integrase [Solirubrobacterales bacterium]
MPARPTVAQGPNCALASPDNPYEQIAVGLYEQIARGEIEVGAHLPTVKEIAATYGVSVGTTTRAVGLLTEWGVVEASRGRRTVVTARPRRARTEPEDVQPVALAEPDEQQAPRGADRLDLRLCRAGETVRAFTARANPSDPDSPGRRGRGREATHSRLARSAMWR